MLFERTLVRLPLPDDLQFADVYSRDFRGHRVLGMRLVGTDERLAGCVTGTWMHATAKVIGATMATNGLMNRTRIGNGLPTAGHIGVLKSSPRMLSSDTSLRTGRIRNRSPKSL